MRKAAQDIKQRVESYWLGHRFGFIITNENEAEIEVNRSSVQSWADHAKEKLKGLAEIGAFCRSLMMVSIL